MFEPKANPNRKKEWTDKASVGSAAIDKDEEDGCKDETNRKECDSTTWWR